MEKIQGTKSVGMRLRTRFDYSLFTNDYSLYRAIHYMAAWHKQKLAYDGAKSDKNKNAEDGT